MENIKNDYVLDSNNRGIIILSTFYLFKKYMNYLQKFEITNLFYDKYTHYFVASFCIFYICKSLYFNKSKEIMIERRMKKINMQMKNLHKNYNEEIIMNRLEKIIEKSRNLKSSNNIQ